MWIHLPVLTVAVLIVGTYVVEAVSLPCYDLEDQKVCNVDCERQGFASGKCDYSRCACYGQKATTTTTTTIPTTRRNRRPKISTIRPLSDSDTTTPKRRAIFCSSNWAGSSGDSCRAFCINRKSNLYASFDSLCCCQKSSTQKRY